MFKLFWPMLLLVSVLLTACSGVKEMYDREVAELDHELSGLRADKVTADELKSLPEAVRLYLSNAGVVGKDRVYRAELRYNGLMTMSRGAKPMPIICLQVNSPQALTRIWYGRIPLFAGLAVEGRHIWKRGQAHMLVKFGPFTIVDLKGDKLAQSDLVTWLNDLFFLPSGLLSTNITWTALDRRSARATVKAGGYSASAVYYFNERFEATNFITQDRYQLDGTNIVKAEWHTPMRRQALMNGLNIATEGEAVWAEQTNTWSYFTIQGEGLQILYNGAGL